MELIAAGSLSAADLATVETLYQESFPDELRAPFADLLRDEVLVPVVDGRPVGFAVLRDLGPTGWTFLRFFAAASKGRGIGSHLWVQLCRHLADTGRTRIMLDVEDPDENGIDPAERTIRNRRIVFYQRLGVDLLPVHDYRPPHGSAAPPLRLLDAPTTPGGPPADLRAVVLAVYEFRYGLPADDPAVLRTLRASGLG